MIRRLCLYLLIACLSLPAVAAQAHCAPTETAAMAETGTGAMGVAMDDSHYYYPGQNHHKAPAERPAQHDCIGCVANFAAAEHLGGSLAPPAGHRVPHIAQALPGSVTRPATPPPRA